MSKSISGEARLAMFQEGVSAIERYVKTIEAKGIGNSGRKDAHESRAFLRGLEMAMFLAK